MRGSLALMFAFSMTACTAPASGPLSQPVTASARPSTAVTPSAAPRFITGMEVVDVTHNSEARGLTCDRGQQVQIQAPAPRTARQWRCQGQIVTGVGVVVTAIGDDQSHLERVLVGTVQTISQPSDAIAAEVLGFYSTLPYKDADPTRSREWVKANVAVSTPATLTVGQATLVVAKVDARTHTLEIRALGWTAAQ